MTRFSGEGSAKYYEPRQACKRIHKAEFVSCACNMLVKDGSFKFVDDGNAEELDRNYFVAIHLSYLTLRQGDKFIIEPYSPHRFGSQFGTIKTSKSIKITLKRKKNEDKQVDGGENNPPHALVPPVVIECDSQAAVVETSKGKEDEVNHDAQAKLHEVEKHIAILESTGPLDDAIVENLESLRARLRYSRKT
ncbi:UNVERIFIED_CONTAM: hypothetical protein Sangu_2766300 [Sesamum angustifolium]|uniref:Uncharacterized protein n=1 Tax=Sesamum angustifolium TaxID=2727405 RepID=A0AAW2IW00_9LAMI